MGNLNTTEVTLSPPPKVLINGSIADISGGQESPLSPRDLILEILGEPPVLLYARQCWINDCFLASMVLAPMPV